ncbi:unnamed protein product [Cyprideis torosa]|uniref:Uncharacterized protein n=1 Tax=Cyprideis torosa TaxID=163714 RepID=A0A7R8WEM8_9CRUS|nr:unnamed protein product [Cyprideis torosa]CAG0894518.1 unnamed protein product [Cyprideis torosa]
MSLLRSFMDEDGGFFRDPFGMDRGGPRGNALMPFGMGGMFGGGIFGQMNQMMQQMERQMSQVNQMMVVYHEAQSTRVGPGGVRETRRLMEDSRRGLRQTAVGHHIGEKGRVIEKDMDLQANTTEEREDLINLSEGEAGDFDFLGEADDFERDWEQRASGYLAGRRGGPVIQAIEDEDHIPQRQAPLAIGYHASTSQAPQAAPVVTHPPHQRRDQRLVVFKVQDLGMVMDMEKGATTSIMHKVFVIMEDVHPRLEVDSKASLECETAHGISSDYLVCRTQTKAKL